MQQKFFIIFTILLILSFTHPSQKGLTMLHEIGHSIHLLISNKVLKQNFKKPKPKIKGYKQVLFLRMYNGKTYSQLYPYFENNKLYSYIRINAISGSLFVCFVLLLFPIIFYFFSKELALYSLIAFLPNCLLEVCNFFGSSDCKSLKHPENFHYTED